MPRTTIRKLPNAASVRPILPGDGTPWPAIARTIWRMAPRPEVGSPKSDPTALSMRPASHNTPNRLPSTTSPRPSRSPHRTTSRNGRCRMVCASARATRALVATPSAGACTTSEAPGAPSAGSAAIAVRPSNTRSRSSRNAPRETTRIMASPSLAPPVSMRTSATPSARCSRFWTASTFWMRPYGMCRSLRKMNPVRTTSSPSSNRYR